MSDTEESGTEAPAPKINKATKKKVVKFTKPLTGAAAAKPATSPAKTKGGYKVGTVARKELSKLRKDVASNRVDAPVDLQRVVTDPKAITKKPRKSIVKNVKKKPPTPDEQEQEEEAEEAGTIEPVDGITPGGLRKSRPASAGGIRKKHKWRAGTVALREIRRYQKSTDNLIPKAAMDRLIREVMADVVARYSDDPTKTLRLGTKAREALQEAAEMYITEKLGDMGTLVHEHKKVTIMPKHLHMLKKLKSVRM